RASWRYCTCGSARNIEGRSAGGRRSVGAGRATHAAVAVDLGHLEIRLAVSVRQAHLYRPLLRWEWHTPNRDTEPAGAERGNRSAQQVNDVVRSGCYGETTKWAGQVFRSITTVWAGVGQSEKEVYSNLTAKTRFTAEL